jgi:hypothetical protein
MIARRTTPRPKALWKQVREQIDGPEPEKPKKLIVRRPKAKPGTAGIAYWPRKRIRYTSKRKARIDKLYMIVRAVILKRNPMCIANDNCAASEIHHSRGKTGTLYLDWRFFKSVCRFTHNWIGDNVLMAAGRGYTDLVKWSQAPAGEITRELHSIISEPSFSKATEQLKTLLRANGLL